MGNDSSKADDGTCKTQTWVWVTIAILALIIIALAIYLFMQNNKLKACQNIAGTAVAAAAKRAN